MNPNRTVITLALCASLSISLPALAKERTKEIKADRPDMAEVKLAGEMPGMEKSPEHDAMMAKWKEYCTPNENHKALEAFVGDWDVTSKMWMGHDGPPMESKGTMSSKMVLDGRFVLSEMKWEMMGMPMVGMGYTGYDTFKKKYTGIWMDNSATAIYTMEGTWADPEQKSMVFYGQMDEWMTGEADKLSKYVYKFVDKKTIVFEIWDMAVGADGKKVMEMTYKKKS